MSFSSTVDTGSLLNPDVLSFFCGIVIQSLELSRSRMSRIVGSYDLWRNAMKEETGDEDAALRWTTAAARQAPKFSRTLAEGIWSCYAVNLVFPQKGITTYCILCHVVHSLGSHNPTLSAKK